LRKNKIKVTDAKTFAEVLTLGIPVNVFKQFEYSFRRPTDNRGSLTARYYSMVPFLGVPFVENSAVFENHYQKHFQQLQDPLGLVCNHVDLRQ
jgi:hypothetical protein